MAVDYDAVASLPADARQIVARALEEDAPYGDITCRTFVDAGSVIDAVVRAREAGVMAGGEVFAEVMRQAAERVGTQDGRGREASGIEPSGIEARGIKVRQHVADGEAFAANDVLISVSGPAHAVLLGERVGLNLLQRMCAIATVTRAYVDAAQAGRARGGLDGIVRVADTRKTTPGLRSLERLAVRCGGGFNHRWGLSDAVMLKDNHVSLLGEGDELTRNLLRGKQRMGHTTHFEVEVDTPEQIEPVLAAGVDTIMLDNFDTDALATGVRQVAGRAYVEASGNVNLETIGAIAATGVDVISVGALTHAVSNLDLGLDAVFADSNCASDSADTETEAADTNSDGAGAVSG